MRVRGEKAVFHALYLKVAGWNVFRVVASGKLAGKVAVAMGRLWSALGLLLLWTFTWGRIRAGGVPKIRAQRHRFQSMPKCRLLAA